MQANNINPLTYLAISLCVFLSSCKTAREVSSNYGYNAPYGQGAIAANPGYSPPVATDDGNQGSHIDETVSSADQQNSDAALALIAAPFVIEGLADIGIIEGLADIVAAVGEAAVNAEIANIIEENVKTTFPDSPPDTQRLLTSVMQNVCTGHPGIRDIAGNFTRSEFNEWVAQRSPEAAKNVHLLETLYEVYKRVHAP